MAERIKVRRLKVGRDTVWDVICSACTSETGIFGDMFGGNWARGLNWSSAMSLAVWHASLHDAERCPTCEVAPSLPRPVIGKNGDGYFRWRGDLYALYADGVRLMQPTTAPPTPERAGRGRGDE